jgi:hypothetical protein
MMGKDQHPDQHRKKKKMQHKRKKRKVQSNERNEFER